MSQIRSGKTCDKTAGRDRLGGCCSNRFAMPPPALAAAFAIHH
jgi:hypothetical protein